MNFMRVYQHNMPLGSAQSFPVLPNGEGVGVRQNPSNSPERIQNTKAQWTCSPVEITYTTQPVSQSAIQPFSHSGSSHPVSQSHRYNRNCDMYAWETNEILETVAEAQKRNATKLNQTRRENRQQIIQKKKPRKK